MSNRSHTEAHCHRQHVYIVAFAILITLALISVSSLWFPRTASAQIADVAGFWADLQPKKARVRPGESILLNLTVGAESGFEGTVKLDFTIGAMGLSYDLDLGTISPPYPKSRLYNVTIPDYVPVSLTAIGVLKAKSGDVLKQEHIEIYVEVPFEPLSLPGTLLSMFLDISRRVLDMSSTWVPTAEGALSSGLLAVGTTVVASSLALAGGESAASFPGHMILKKIFDLFPGSIKKWLGDYVKSKSPSREVKGSTFMRRRELAVMSASGWMITLAYAYIRSKTTMQILLMIPFVLATNAVIDLGKDLTAKMVAKTQGVSAECRLTFQGTVVFALSTFFFKTPISSPKKMYYESDKSTKRSRGLVGTATVLMPLVIFACFYLIFTQGHAFLGAEHVFLGNMGMTICLTSALNDSLPVRPMNGRNVYNWNRVLWALLFVGSFLAYALQFLIS